MGGRGYIIKHLDNLQLKYNRLLTNNFAKKYNLVEFLKYYFNV